MAKERERLIAKTLYIETNCTKKDGAAKVGVTEKTFGKWVDDGKWDAEREARNASPAKRVNNIKEIISNLSEEWLSIDRQIKAFENNGDIEELARLRSRMSCIDDAVSKWNKTLESVEKESRVPLSTYLRVMEEIFADLREYDKVLFIKSVDFQSHHIEKASIKLG